jgi:hypothetical protein
MGDIASIHVMNNTDDSLDGDNAEKNVVFIKSKQFQDKENKGNKELRIKNTKPGEEPLYIVDGKPVINLSHIATDNIESVNVWKGDDAIEKYGQAAKYGVVEVKTKIK